jgi:hypothetical protein
MVIPAYNEEATIAVVAREWHAVLFSTVVRIPGS